ncbi:MAG TPA: ABC transporter ATP-binding protein [candidate division Zixibacteria bacterium]|nr:ABC transporter ATP-binding protein [candidate division Zixibacteria bacterium]
MSGTDAHAIGVRDLTKRYGEVLALDGLSLDVPAGSVYGFLGPNGAGKTTTLRILTSLARADAGEAWVMGVPVGDGEPNRRGLIGYLDQDPRFHGWMRGRELLLLVGDLYGMRGAALRARVDEVLEVVGLTEAAGRSISGYSGGMRQRLGLAQAILNRPPVLLLDEPVSALDPEGRRDLLEVIRRLGGESTVLLSTHILNDVERVCDRVAILDRGRLVTAGPMDELLARYARPVYVIEPEEPGDGLLGRLADAMRAVPGVTDASVTHTTVRVAVTDDAVLSTRLLGAVATCGIPVVRFEQQRPSLEDVFLQLVGRGAREAA